MACQHVGKKTYDQGKWLGKYAQEFNQHQDRLNTHWHRRIECVSPEMFVTAKQNNDEGNDTENKGERNISDHIRRTRYQTQQIIDQYKKENGKEVWHVFAISRTQVWLCHLIANKGDYWFNCILKTRRRRGYSMPL